MFFTAAIIVLNFDVILDNNQYEFDQAKQRVTRNAEFARRHRESTSELDDLLDWNIRRSEQVIALVKKMNRPDLEDSIKRAEETSIMLKSLKAKKREASTSGKTTEQAFGCLIRVSRSAHQRSGSELHFKMKHENTKWNTSCFVSCFRDSICVPNPTADASRVSQICSRPDQ